MRVFKISLLILVLLVGLGTFEKKAEAHTAFSFGFSNYYPGYFHSYYPYWYGYGWPSYYGYGFYRPYFYRPYYYGPSYGYRYYGYGELRIEVKPKTAKVYVDGAYTGTVDDYDGWWQRLKLEPGSHRIVIREPGFAPYAETVRVLPGEDSHIKIQMQPGEDRISQSEMLPERRNDDRYDRRYNDRGDRYGYRPRHDYDRDRDRYREKDRDSDRYDNEDRDRSDDRSDNYRSENNAQERNKQTFVLQVDPRDATIYIDGNYYGTADVNDNGEVQVLLGKGVHKVEVVRPGFESFSQNITIDGQDDNRLMVQLHKK